MKHLKTYKELNEGLRDKMLPKSDEEILKELDKLPPNEMLIKSIKYNFLDGIKKIFKKRVDNLEIDYALEIAIENGNLDIIKYLIKNGANVHTNINTHLQISSANGYLDIVKYLVEKGADIHSNKDYALSLACENGHLNIVKYLVEQGADIHANYGLPFQYASEKGYTDILNYLKSKIKDK